MKSLLFSLLLFAVSANAQTSITVVWTAPGDDGYVGTADRYELVFSTDSTDLYAQVDDFKGCGSCAAVTGLPTPLVAGTVQEVTVSGLELDTFYWVAMRAGDEIPNWSGISNIVKISTRDSVPPATITDLRIKP